MFLHVRRTTHDREATEGRYGYGESLPGSMAPQLQMEWFVLGLGKHRQIYKSKLTPSHIPGARHCMRLPTIDSLPRSYIRPSCGRIAGSARRSTDLKIYLAISMETSALAAAHPWPDCIDQCTIHSHTLRNSTHAFLTLHDQCLACIRARDVVKLEFTPNFPRNLGT